MLCFKKGEGRSRRMKWMWKEKRMEEMNIFNRIQIFRLCTIEKRGRRREIKELKKKIEKIDKDR